MITSQCIDSGKLLIHRRRTCCDSGGICCGGVAVALN